MQVNIEDVSAVKKVLKFEIDKETVDAELDKYYAEIGKEASLKGFRKGKVPRSVLEGQFAEDANAQVIPQLIQDALWGTIQEHKFRIVCDADVDVPEKALHAGQPFVFTATIEVAPDMDNVEYKGLKLEKYKVDIIEEDIDTQLEQLQQRYAEKVPAPEGYGLVNGDTADVTYQGYDENGEALKAGLSAGGTNRELNIGENAILGQVDQAMQGMKAGETREITVNFPNDYYHRTLAEKTVRYEMTVNSIKQRVLPEIGDELAKKTGSAQTIEELREKIGQELTNRVNMQNERGMYEQMFEQLADRFDAELPEGLVELKMDGIYEEMKKSFEQQELNFEMMGITRESMADRYRGTAEKQAKFHLVVGKIIEQEGIVVTREDLDEGYKELARDLMVPVTQLKMYYSEHPEDQVALRNGLMERKVFKLIMDNADVVEKEPPTAEEIAKAREEAMKKDMENFEKDINMMK